MRKAHKALRVLSGCDILRNRGDGMERWKAGWLLCLLLMALQGQALGETRLYSFSSDDVPAELSETAMQVNTRDVTIALTLAGDCTLGGRAGTLFGAKGFGTYIRNNGVDYPFAQLQGLFGKDDLTVVNLEGVLSDEREDKTPGKLFHFIGESGYVDILTQGSVECVNLANNHAMDYGRRGYEDTLQVLEGAGVIHFGEDAVAVLEKDGMRIGLTGSQFALSGQRMETLDRQLAALEKAGCQWIVHTLHAGSEYDTMPTQRQRAAAAYAAENGANLVVGHHPHVVQGMDRIGKVPVLYSLGNCCFGGNLRPDDMDACLLRVEITFTGGQLSSMQLTLWPILISGEKRSNNFQPLLAKGEDAKRVMEKLQASSTLLLAPYQEGQGALQPVIWYQGQEE